MRIVHLYFVFSLWLLTMQPLRAQVPTQQEVLKEESKLILERSIKIAERFYVMADEEDLREITDDILASRETSDLLKECIMRTQRRFFLFRYPSDGFWVKGYVSLVPEPLTNPLLILLRGGNRIFGLANPANDFSCVRNYTVLATAYRGGVSEGADEFGGDEVNDVENLIRYLPQLEQKLALQLAPSSVSMLGVGRGAMEMFLALGRSSFLQNYVSRAASLSGVLDMPAWMRHREDVRHMFVRDFGLIPGVNEEQWIQRRNPLNAVPLIKKDLPFLIIQRTRDTRAAPEEGRTMFKKLQENGNCVEYWEVSDGDYCLKKRMEWIADWFEK
ncbi:MAG TPA: hypothetical protein VGJ00_07315 [Rhabdochlamydiaceae bacterium]